jgi:hypothetical protein
MWRAAVEAVCCCKWLYGFGGDAQLGVTEQHGDFHQLNARGDQETGRDGTAGRALQSGGVPAGGVHRTASATGALGDGPGGLLRAV